METVLLVLCFSPAPLKAAQISVIVNRPDTAVRSTLRRLGEFGFAVSTQVGSQGPSGTYVWTPTQAGRDAVARLVTFLRSGGKL